MSHPSPIPELPTTPPPPHPSRATEEPALYRAGGYHPVPQLPYDLAPAYRIIHKLSFNDSSTSWLAVRRPGAGNAISSTASTSTIASNFGSESSSSTATRSSSSSASWAGAELVEIKILTAAASKVSPEAEILRKLTHRGFKEKLLGKMMLKNNNKKASALVQDFIDDFYVMGPNGRHRCIVTEALGPSIEDVQRMVGGLLPPKVGRDAVVAVVRGVEGMHAKGVIHGGMFAHVPLPRPRSALSFSNPKITHI